MSDAHVYLQADMTAPEVVELAGAKVCVYSRRCPGKATPNEDAALVMPTDGGGILLAVADGMGGEAHGEIASRIAIESLRCEVAAAAETDALVRTAVINGLERANEAVLKEAAGAGTTLAAIEISATAARPYHVGDSVVLIVGGRGKIKLQTVAHSPVGYGVESGLLDEADAIHHDDRHIISNFVGTDEMRIDIGSPRKLARRDTVLLASDGLFDNLHVDEVVEMVRRGSLTVAVARLATTAAQRMETTGGGEPSKPDDLTMLALRLSGSS